MGAYENADGLGIRRWNKRATPELGNNEVWIRRGNKGVGTGLGNNEVGIRCGNKEAGTGCGSNGGRGPGIVQGTVLRIG